MDRVIFCVARDHDWRLTVLAVLVCVIGLGVSVRFMERTRPRDPAGRRRAVVTATAISALSVWALTKDRV